MEDKIKKLYLDQPSWFPAIKEDDFIVAIGAKQSNSVYHVIKSVPKPREPLRMTRYHLQVFKSDLPTALKRDKSQQLIPMAWYSRDSKAKSPRPHINKRD